MHVCAVLDEAGHLHPGIHVHVAVLVELMSQVGGMNDQWQISIIELERGRVDRLSNFWSTHTQTFGLGLGWVGNSTKLQFIFNFKLFTDF